MNKNWIKTWAILAPHGFKRRQIKVRSKTFFFFIISQLHTRLFQTMKFKSLPYSHDGVVLIGILPSKETGLPFNRDSIIPLSPYQI